MTSAACFPLLAPGRSGPGRALRRVLMVTGE
jgi:hypothetical protein